MKMSGKAKRTVLLIILNRKGVINAPIDKTSSEVDALLEQIGDVTNLSLEEIHDKWSKIDNSAGFSNWFWKYVYDGDKLLKSLSTVRKVYAVEKK
jgi:hypothetical protein